MAFNLQDSPSSVPRSKLNINGCQSVEMIFPATMSRERRNTGRERQGQGWQETASDPRHLQFCRNSLSSSSLSYTPPLQSPPVPPSSSPVKHGSIHPGLTVTRLVLCCEWSEVGMGWWWVSWNGRRRTLQTI